MDNSGYWIGIDCGGDTMSSGFYTWRWRCYGNIQVKTCLKVGSREFEERPGQELKIKLLNMLMW